jgi:hypothetical protein
MRRRDLVGHPLWTTANPPVQVVSGALAPPSGASSHTRLSSAVLLVLDCGYGVILLIVRLLLEGLGANLS